MQSTGEALQHAGFKIPLVWQQGGEKKKKKKKAFAPVTENDFFFFFFKLEYVSLEIACH